MDKKILIVEDDDVLVSILEKIIESLGFKALHTYSIHEAREIVKAEPLELILLDLNLGDERGYELLEKEAKNPKLTSTPVIVLTSSRAKSDIIIGKSRGAVDYVIKPFNGKDLINRIEKVLSDHPA